MAYQYVYSFIADGGTNSYTVRFDPNGSPQFEVIHSGSGTPNTYYSDADLGVPAGTQLTYFCDGFNEYQIFASNNYPFATATLVPNSPNCGYVETPPPPPADVVRTYTLVYRGTFSNTEQGFLQDDTDTIEAVAIFIADARSLVDGEAATTYIDFECAGDPLKLTTIDNDESIYTPIRATQATIQFNSSNDISAETFVEGEDNRWHVYIVIKGQTIFQGFLITDELTEDWNFAPNVVTLVATDGLGLLKDAPLVKPDGTAPKFTEASKGNYKLIEYLAWALQLTGLRLDIHIADNLFEESFPSLCAWDNIYLNYKTFEGESIGECINAYDVITRLLKDDLYLTQHQNAWWIRRIDELENRTTSYFRFDYTGAYLGQNTNVDLRRAIAQNTGYQIIEHINEATTKHYRRPFNKVIETFNYNLPKEIVDNQDFSRGQWLSMVTVPDKTVDIGTPNEKTLNGSAYSVEDWTAVQGLFPSTTPADGAAFIYRYFFEGIETERFLHLSTDVSADQWLRSNPIPVHYKDRFTFNIDVRVNEAKLIVLGPQTMKLFIILEGDDGVNYWLDAHKAEEQEAKDVVLGPSTSVANIWPVYDGSATGLPFTVSTTESNGFFITFDIPEKYTPVPVSGNLYILLPFLNDFVDYENLQFTYTPYINGSYAPYKGQQHIVGNTPGFKAVRDEEVFLSDSPKRLFKGCLLKKNDLGKFIQTGKWYNGAVFPTPPADNYYHSKGHTQIFSIWNQHNRQFNILDSTLQGLLTTITVSESGVPSCVHEWVHADDTPHTNNRRWMLVHYEQDYNSCEWTGYFVEVFNTTIDKQYDDTHTFKYLRG